MISLIIKSYLSILLSIGFGSIFIFVVGLYCIVKFHFRDKQKSIKISIEDNEISDLHAIAGEDLMATRLDLARAYIETDKKYLAKKILQSVLEKGTYIQQTQAKNLMNLL